MAFFLYFLLAYVQYFYYLCNHNSHFVCYCFYILNIPAVLNVLTDLRDLKDLKVLIDLKQTTILIFKKILLPPFREGRGRQIMKKLFTLFLALIASIGIASAQSGTCGDNLRWTLSNGTLTISGTGTMADYSSYTNAPWYDYHSSIKSIVINDGVTSIGSQAFAWCSSLTSVTIGNSVTSIGDGAFLGCSSLTSITIPNSVTSIGNQAFLECSSLTSITIGNSVTSIGEFAFSECPSLTSVTIPNSVTSIGQYAFAVCSSLASVTIGNSVTNIEWGAFYGCTSLTSVTNYAMQPQAIVKYDFEDVDLPACQLYVPSTSVGLYQTAKVWKDFGNIQPIRAEDITDVSETIITPSENEVEITWPTVSGAASYELVIKDKDGNIVCTLIFNANGQLTSIAFNAPSRNGAPAQTQSAGFSFTITGLESGTNYDLTLTAKDNSGNTIEETTIPFHTDYPEGIENVQSDEVQGTKVVKDGQVLILRNDKTYTIQGVEVK